MSRRPRLDAVSYDAVVDLVEHRSRTTVRFDCAAPGASTSVDLAVRAIESASLNGIPVPAAAWQDGRLSLSGLEATNVLEVTAVVTTDSDDRDGLVAFVDDGGERFVYTHGRTNGTARWAPLFSDTPATWTLEVRVPDDWHVLSHAPPSGDGWRFRPPYQLPDGPTFAAGPWRRVDSAAGVPTWARPSVADTLARSPVGDLVASAIASHEQVLGVRYPYETRDCIFIPGYGSQAGCSGGLILFHERVLHGSVDDEWLRYVRWVVAHEAAHSWFGGLVGFDGAEHRWTAEGVATYLCHRANASWPRFHVLEELEAHGDDETAPDAPSLIYAKPAAVLRHLESIIGVGAVDAGLSALLRKHAGAMATGDDLVECWSAVGGVDLSGWADDWLRAPGVNTLAFDRSAGVIRQTGTPLRTHHVTVQAVPGPSIEVVITGAATPAPAHLRDADLVVLNAPARTYAKVRLDPRSRATLATALGSLDDDVRAACWVAAVEMVRDGLMPRDELRAWVEAFAAAEPDRQVRDLLAGEVSAR